MLGTDLARHFSKTHEVLTPSHADLDITDWQAVGRWVREHEPAVLMNAAAYTNVDGAEKEREQAYNLNVMAVANLVEWCSEFDVKLVHFSTDQVFDGTTRAPRTEDEPAHPSNYYAETKFLGEKEAARDPNNLILRVQWLYGAKKDRFTPLKDKTVFSPFADQFGAPMWTAVIAETVEALLAKEASGVFHLAYDDYASWADVFAFVKEELGLSLKLEPKATADMNLPARRPLFSVLSNRKLCAELGRENFGSWKPALREFLKSR